MNEYYPDKHHPVFFLMAALQQLGATVEFHRDKRTHGCWGLIVNGRVFTWLVDNRWIHEREHEDPAAAQLLGEGAIVCCAQKPDAERVGAKWLPLAVTPGYAPKSLEKLFDVAFVGYIRDAMRQMILANIASQCRLSYANGVFQEQASDTYCQARVAFNVPTFYGHPLAYDVSMRVFEGLATGVPLVTNWLPDLTELGIIDGKTAFLYEHPDAILPAIQRALDNPQVGQAGAALAQERHTYTHRAQQVMEWIV